MANLKTNYKDRLLDTSVNTERKFNLVGSDGNVIASGVSLRDITQYSQAGDTFGAADINKITAKINEQNNNLTQQKADSVAFPNYNNTIAEITTKNASYAATENCWVIGSMVGELSGAAAIIVDDVTVQLYGNAKDSSSSSSVVAFPVKKGSVVKTRAYGTYALKIYGMQ